MKQAAEDIGNYSLARTLKDPQDAFEYFEWRDKGRPYIVEYLRQTFAIVEDVHERGLRPFLLDDLIRREVPNLFQAAIRTKKTSKYDYPGMFATEVWQAILIERSGEKPVFAA